MRKAASILFVVVSAGVVFWGIAALLWQEFKDPVAVGLREACEPEQSRVEIAGFLGFNPQSDYTWCTTQHDGRWCTLALFEAPQMEGKRTLISVRDGSGANHVAVPEGERTLEQLVAVDAGGTRLEAGSAVKLVGTRKGIGDCVIDVETIARAN